MRRENNAEKQASWRLLRDGSDVPFSPVWYETETLYCSFSVPLSIFHYIYHCFLSLIVATPLLNLFNLSIFLSLILLSLCFWQTLFSSTPSPLDGLFRFLMSLYLALLDKRNVSEAFYPGQNFSCHLGHFSPSATLGLYSISCTTLSIHLSLSSHARDSLWHIRCISRGNQGQIRMYPNNNHFFPLGTFFSCSYISRMCLCVYVDYLLE